MPGEWGGRPQNEVDGPVFRRDLAGSRRCREVRPKRRLAAVVASTRHGPSSSRLGNPSPRRPVSIGRAALVARRLATEGVRRASIRSGGSKRSATAAFVVADGGFCVLAMTTRPGEQPGIHTGAPAVTRADRTLAHRASIHPGTEVRR